MHLVTVGTDQEKDDGTPGDLLVKQAHKEEATVQATDGYKTRVSITANYTLLISQGSLSDQRTFTCMVVSSSNLDEYSVNVQVHSKSPVHLVLAPSASGQ